MGKYVKACSSPWATTIVWVEDDDPRPALVEGQSLFDDVSETGEQDILEPDDEDNDEDEIEADFEYEDDPETGLLRRVPVARFRAPEDGRPAGPASS